MWRAAGFHIWQRHAGAAESTTGERASTSRPACMPWLRDWLALMRAAVHAGACVAKRIAGAAGAAAVGTQRPDPPLSPEPGGSSSSERQSVGEPCQLRGVGESTCPWPLVCRMHVLTGTFSCREAGE